MCFWLFDGLLACFFVLFFKPPPPVGAGGGYMFSGHPSVPLSVRASVRASVRPWFTWYFYVSAISPVSVDRFSPNFCHWCILGQRWPDYVFGSKGQSSRSHHRGGGAQHSTLPSSATFSSFIILVQYYGELMWSHDEALQHVQVNSSVGCELWSRNACTLSASYSYSYVSVSHAAVCLVSMWRHWRVCCRGHVYVYQRPMWWIKYCRRFVCGM